MYVSSIRDRTLNESLIRKAGSSPSEMSRYTVFFDTRRMFATSSIFKSFFGSFPIFIFLLFLPLFSIRFTVLFVEIRLKKSPQKQPIICEIRHLVFIVSREFVFTIFTRKSGKFSLDGQIQTFCVFFAKSISSHFRSLGFTVNLKRATKSKILPAIMPRIAGRKYADNAPGRRSSCPDRRPRKD